MRNPQGYACISSPDGVREADTFTCGHHGGIVHVKAGARPEDCGGLCKICMKLICSKCVDEGGCVPLEKRLEQEEARYHALRSYGI